MSTIPPLISKYVEEVEVLGTPEGISPPYSCIGSRIELYTVGMKYYYIFSTVINNSNDSRTYRIRSLSVEDNSFFFVFRNRLKVQLNFKDNNENPSVVVQILR